MFDETDIELRRDELQHFLDAQKSHSARNEMGQFATPFPLAYDIMRFVAGLLPNRKVSFLEPAFGTGVFLSAFIRAIRREPAKALGFEIDPHYCSPAKKHWSCTKAEIKCSDFLRQTPDQLFDLIATNPPYTRHHHISSEDKVWLQKAVLSETGIKISGLAGLYCHFLMLSTKWLAPDGLSCWLIPCEFMDVNYGVAVRRYLSENVELIRIHRFNPEDLQFADALVSSCVVVFRNRRPSERHRVEFSSGGSIISPGHMRTVSIETLRQNGKWIPHFSKRPKALHAGGKTLGDYFFVKRGIATGDNGFFILDEESALRHNIPSRFLRPILPGPRYVKVDRIKSDNGIPDLGRKMFLFSCDLPKEDLRKDYPTVWQYICDGEARGVNEGYICSRRTPWYSCEKRDAAPIVVPYMGRGADGGRLFRFILNESDAITTNGYLMLYPKMDFAEKLKNRTALVSVWKALNGIPPETLVSSGRTYGGGLHKLEPRELMRAPACDAISGI